MDQKDFIIRYYEQELAKKNMECAVSASMINDLRKQVEEKDKEIASLKEKA